MAKLDDDDQMTCIVTLSREMRALLRKSARLSAIDYRLLAYISSTEPNAFPTRAAATLESRPSTISSAIARTKSKGMIAQAQDAGRPTKPLSLTEKGSHSLATCDNALIEYCNELFAGLSAELRHVFPISSLLTTAQHRKPRLLNGNYFAEYAFFEGTLMTEQFFIKSTRAHDLSLDAFRILHRLLSCEKEWRMRDLGYDLLMTRADVSEACAKLKSLGLVITKQASLDARGKTVEISSRGTEVAKSISKSFEDYSQALRPTAKGEVSLFNSIWHQIAQEKRSEKTKK